MKLSFSLKCIWTNVLYYRKKIKSKYRILPEEDLWVRERGIQIPASPLTTCMSSSKLPNPWFHFPHLWKGISVLSHPVMKLHEINTRAVRQHRACHRPFHQGFHCSNRSVILRVWSGGEQHQTPLELVIMQIINFNEPRPTESVSQGRAQHLAILLPLKV